MSVLLAIAAGQPGATDAGTIRIAESATGREVRRLAGHTDVVNTLQPLVPPFLLSASNDGTVRVWNALTGRCCRTVPVCEPADYSFGMWDEPTACVSPDGRLLAVALRAADMDGCSTPGRLKLYRGDSCLVPPPMAIGLETTSWPAPGTARLLFDAECDDGSGRAIAWSPDSGCLAFGGETLYLLDGRRPADRQRWRRLDMADEDVVYALAFSPDGKSLAAAGFNHIVLYDLASGTPRWSLSSFENNAVTFSGTGRWLAVVGEGFAELVDAITGEILHELDHGRVGMVNAVARSSDDRYLATGHKNGKVRIWEVASRVQVQETTCRTPMAVLGVSSLAFIGVSDEASPP